MQRRKIGFVQVNMIDFGILANNREKKPLKYLLPFGMIFWILQYIQRFG